MKRKSLLGILVLFFFVITAGAVWSQELIDGNHFSIMRPDSETLHQWIRDFENSPRAPLNSN